MSVHLKHHRSRRIFGRASIASACRGESDGLGRRLSAHVDKAPTLVRFCQYDEREQRDRHAGPALPLRLRPFLRFVARAVGSIGCESGRSRRPIGCRRRLRRRGPPTTRCSFCALACSRSFFGRRRGLTLENGQPAVRVGGLLVDGGFLLAVSARVSSAVRWPSTILCANEFLRFDADALRSYSTFAVACWKDGFRLSVACFCSFVNFTSSAMNRSWIGWRTCLRNVNMPHEAVLWT